MVKVSEGKRAVSTIEVVTCKACGARVKCEDGKPVEVCCPNFEK